MVAVSADLEPTSYRRQRNRSGRGGCTVAVTLLGPDSEAWVASLSRLRHDSYHLPGYVRLHAEMAGGRACALRYHDGRDELLLPLVLTELEGGGWDAASPYGYPGPLATTRNHAFWSAALRSVVEELARRDVVTLFVRLHPLLVGEPTALAALGTLVRHGETVSLDLRAGPSEVVAQFRGNHRRGIARSRRAGTTVVVDDWDLLDAFVDAYHDTMGRVGASPEYFFPHSYFHALVTELPGTVHLLCAVRQGDLLGGGVFLSTDGITQYHLGATWTRALNEQPMKLVFDETWRWAKDRGDTDLHLGGGVGGVDDSLFHFKAGFSQRRHAFETVRVVLDTARYEQLCQRAGLDVGEDLTSFFPRFRRPAQCGMTEPLS